MNDDPAEFTECAVCGRNILRGERVSQYVTPEREVVAVCALCKTRAEQMGWTQASLAGTPGFTEPQRRRGFDLRARLRGGRARRGRGTTADELAREIGIPDAEPTDGPAAPGETPERRFAFPDTDEDDVTRFPEPVAAPGSERFGPDDDDPDPDEDFESAEVDRDAPFAAEATEHGLAEPTSFWDEDASSAAERPPELRADEGAEDLESEARGDGPAPAREPRPAQTRRRSPRSARRQSDEPLQEASAEPPRRQPRTPGRLMRTAAENFNASDEARKVGGLMRSLGEPSVSLRPPAREDLPALLTVAWELSWYQWEVGVELDDSSVREIAKGNEIAELDDAAQRWNARADEDGLIRLRRAGHEEDGE